MQKTSRALNSSKVQEKRRKQMIGIIVIFFIALIAILTALFFLLRAPFVQITALNVSGNTLANSDLIKSMVLDDISGMYAGIIPKSDSIFYPKTVIINSVKNSFNDVDSVAVSRDGFSALNIAITEKPPVALVCEGFPDDSPGDDVCYFTDSTGYVFQKIDSTAFNLSSSTLMRYYIGTDDASSIVGSNFVATTTFQGLEKFVQGSEQAGMTPTGVLIGDNSQYEMYLSGGTTIYFDDRAPFDQTLSNFLTFWNNAQQEATSKATTTPDFDYINLRYGNNIFYSKK